MRPDEVSDEEQDQYFDSSFKYGSAEKTFMQERSAYMESMAKHQSTVLKSRVAEIFGELE